MLNNLILYKIWEWYANNNESILILTVYFTVEDITKMGSDFLDGERPALVRPSCTMYFLAPPKSSISACTPFVHVTHNYLKSNCKLVFITHYCG